MEKRLTVLLTEDEKMEFKINSARNKTTMSELLRDIVLSLNKNPEKIKTLCNQDKLQEA